MSLSRAALVLTVFLGLASVVPAEDAAKEKKKNEAELAKIDAQIKKTPDDPAAHARRAQMLIKLERWNDGYAAAEKSMECSIKKGDNVASILLESIDIIGEFRIEVLFNMGSRERKPPEMGIVRPLSFRVIQKADKNMKESKDALVEVIDFELGYMDKKAETAAFGITDGSTHKNLGMQGVNMSYGDIRVKATELIKQRHPPEEAK